MSSTKQETFESVFQKRIDDVASACVGCGSCFDVCPITDAAGLQNLDGEKVTKGILDIIKTGEGPKASARFAEACILSGDCIDACEHGVNPRLMLTMARYSQTKAQNTEKTRRGNGLKTYRKLGRDVKILSRIQLNNDQLARLGQRPSHTVGEDKSPPDVVLYTGCNVLKTPHIALLCLDILDALSIKYEVLGGPSNCCGILHHRAGDVEAANRMGSQTLERFEKTGAARVLSWCPSCQVQFNEVNIPNYADKTGRDVLNMTPFMFFLEENIDKLKTLFTQNVPMKIALHGHNGIKGIPNAARRLLRAVPGVELIDLGQPEMGLMSNSFKPIRNTQQILTDAEFNAAINAEVDALVAVYHADHRELCAHEINMPFQILNVLEIFAASMGLHQDDQYKALKLTQDADRIFEDCADLIEQNGIDPFQAKSVIQEGLLDDQPMPLKASSKQSM